MKTLNVDRKYLDDNSFNDERKKALDKINNEVYAFDNFYPHVKKLKCEKSRVEYAPRECFTYDENYISCYRGFDISTYEHNLSTSSNEYNKLSVPVLENPLNRLSYNTPISVSSYIDTDIHNKFDKPIGENTSNAFNEASPPNERELYSNYSPTMYGLEKQHEPFPYPNNLHPNSPHHNNPHHNNPHHNTSYHNTSYHTNPRSIIDGNREDYDYLKYNCFNENKYYFDKNKDCVNNYFNEDDFKYETYDERQKSDFEFQNINFNYNIYNNFSSNDVNYITNYDYKTFYNTNYFINLNDKYFESNKNERQRNENKTNDNCQAKTFPHNDTSNKNIDKNSIFESMPFLHLKMCLNNNEIDEINGANKDAVCFHEELSDLIEILSKDLQGDEGEKKDHYSGIEDIARNDGNFMEFCDANNKTTNKTYINITKSANNNNNKNNDSNNITKINPINFHENETNNDYYYSYCYSDDSYDYC